MNCQELCDHDEVTFQLGSLCAVLSSIGKAEDFEEAVLKNRISWQHEPLLNNPAVPVQVRESELTIHFS